MEQKCNSIFFARGPHFPMKALENLRAVGVGATVAQGWMICSMLEQHRWMASQQPLLPLSLLLFRVVVRRDFQAVSDACMNRLKDFFPFY